MTDWRWNDCGLLHNCCQISKSLKSLVSNVIPYGLVIFPALLCLIVYDQTLLLSKCSVIAKNMLSIEQDHGAMTRVGWAPASRRRCPEFEFLLVMVVSVRLRAAPLLRACHLHGKVMIMKPKHSLIKTIKKLRKRGCVDDLRSEQDTYTELGSSSVTWSTIRNLFMWNYFLPIWKIHMWK